MTKFEICATLDWELAQGEQVVTGSTGSMKHVISLTKNRPALAIDGHPTVYDSISAFLKDPLGVIELHFEK